MSSTAKPSRFSTPHYPIDSRDCIDEDRDEAAALAASLAAQVGTE